MQALRKRIINPGNEYDYLFPPAMNRDKTVVENATLDDTIDFIHRVVNKTLKETEGIAKKLSGRSVYETCSNIWHFVYNNVAYKKDADGLEQIRSPSRTWYDRKKGVDCDCYSTFISSILTNLRIPHMLRITKYSQNHFQHIYPVVQSGGKLIILDCVTEKFDYEVPYSEKKDIVMDLQFLDGLEGINERGEDVVFDGYIGELGAAKKKKKKGFFKKLLNKINKINPATILLRNGVLAAMKLNLFKVASRLKYAYLSPEDAVKRGIIKDKYDKLVKVKEKLESIFEGAGGNPKNLKKAILKGKGNKNKEVAVSGLGFADADSSVLYMNSNTPLAQLLGPEIYYDENVNGMEGFEGFGELGEPATGAAIAAATAAMAAIAKLIKGIGNIFGSGQKGSEDFSESETAAADKEVVDAPSASSSSTTSPAATTSSSLIATSSGDDSTYSSSSDSSTSSPSAVRISSDDSTNDPATSDSAPSSSSTGTTSLAVASAASSSSSSSSNQGFWQKNKKWLLPAVIGVGGIAAIAIGMKMLKSNPPHSGTNGLEGASTAKKQPNRKKQSPKRKSVALM